MNLNKRYKLETIADSKDSPKKESVGFKDILCTICNYNTEKRRNIILLKINIKIIIDKLDILNIFRNMCLIENINKTFKLDLNQCLINIKGVIK